jgi:acrylyl-CoA reductase (NADPH)
MRALLLEHDADGNLRAVVREIEESGLPEGDVLIDVSHSALNYKDGLAVTGKGKIIRGAFPFVPGIDLAGVVAESRTDAFARGDRVALTGWGTGEERWGGYAGRARARAENLVRIPEGMSAADAMHAGTAGVTAALAAEALGRLGVAPGAGAVCVTGASGGVGSFAVALLAHAGYDVHAVTGSPDAHDYLRRLGASTIVDRVELEAPAPAMGKARWAGAVDTVGGAILSHVIATTGRHGVVAACGNAGGAELHTTVFPFILRGVVLYGVDSNTATAGQRAEAWARLAAAHAAGALGAIERTTITLEEVPVWAERITRGETTGRVVVQVQP